MFQNHFDFFFDEIPVKMKVGIVDLQNSKNKCYIHGSVHRESNLITVQQDASYSVYYTSVGDQPRGLVVRVSDY